MTTDASVLVVDDDADLRECIKDALEDEGYRVTAAANGKEALRLLRDDVVRPDIILLDIMMPEMDGWAFRAEQLRDAKIASIPVLVFTAHGSPRDVARELHTAGFLTKPLRLEELLSAISGAVGP